MTDRQTKLMVPTVHSNGTSREELVRQLCDAGEAVATAVQAVYAAAPHGRDYYMQGPEALKQANAEHIERLRKLEAVYAELTALAEDMDAK